MTAPYTRHTEKAAWSQTAYDARRINSMALHMEPEDIANQIGAPLEVVLAIIKRDDRAARWVARCEKTGRCFYSPTERGAYLRAQIAGFADWRLYGEARV